VVVVEVSKTELLVVVMVEGRGAGLVIPVIALIAADRQQGSLLSNFSSDSAARLCLQSCLPFIRKCTTWGCCIWYAALDLSQQHTKHNCNPYA